MSEVLKKLYQKIENISLKTLLVFTGVGIWVIVLQNAGVIPTKQNVYVKGGYINADITGRVEVEGSVQVDNTVSVSIDEVLDKDGKKYYFKNY